jgi:FKBP-type peptidyl-prolyl cis-trans isomerase
MVTWRGGLLFAMTATAAACWNPIEPPPCVEKPFTQTSVNGDTIVTSSGLRFIEVAVGGGSAAPWCQAVTVDYDAFLLDSTKFDSSRDLGVPLHFVPGVGDLIDGFEQGVIGMRAGGKRRLIIPSELGYGSEPVRNGSGTIIVPANSTLVFDVELLVVGQ